MPSASASAHARVAPRRRRRARVPALTAAPRPAPASRGPARSSARGLPSSCGPWRTTGMRSKLWCGGGDGTVHSSVPTCHGLASRLAPARQAPEEVDDEDQLRRAQQERRVRDAAVQRQQRLEEIVGRRIVEPPLHAGVADQQLPAEDQVERDDASARSAACRAARSSSARTSWGTRSRSPRTTPAARPPPWSGGSARRRSRCRAGTCRRRCRPGTGRSGRPRPKTNTSPSANSIGVAMRIAPRQIVPSQLRNSSIAGTEMIMVSSMKLSPSIGLMPVTNMWWP